jgi:hypothetical protein
LDILTIITPFWGGVGIGVLALIYGSVKMEFSFGVLGFFLCFIAGSVFEFFI